MTEAKIKILVLTVNELLPLNKTRQVFIFILISNMKRQLIQSSLLYQEAILQALWAL